MESFFQLNWLDIVIICLLLIGMLNGLSKGLVVSVLNATGVFIALLGAKYFSGPVSLFIINNTNAVNNIKTTLDKKIASAGVEVFSLFKLFNVKKQYDTKQLAVLFITVICFLVLFCLIIILINIIKTALKITLSHTPLKYVDRLGGAVVGIVIAAVFIFIFFAVVTPIAEMLPSDRGLVSAIGKSKFATYFYLYNFIIPWLQKVYTSI